MSSLESQPRARTLPDPRAEGVYAGRIDEPRRKGIGKGGRAIMSRSSVIVLEQAMVKSRAWLSLSRTALLVYPLFRCKCRFAKRSRRYGKHSEGLMERLSNNGEIEFTYGEAEQQHGITAGRFVRAIDELVEKGFLDVAEPGGGVHKLTTLYGISDRWRDYGTPSFQQAHRPERSIKCGFRKGNKLWQKARRKKSTAIGAHGRALAMRKNAHGEILAMRTDAHGKKLTNRHICREDKGLCAQIT